MYTVCNNFLGYSRDSNESTTAVHCSFSVIVHVFWRQSNWEKSDYVRSTQRIILLGQISSGCSVIRNRLHFKRSLYHARVAAWWRLETVGEMRAVSVGLQEKMIKIGSDCAQFSHPPPARCPLSAWVLFESRQDRESERLGRQEWECEEKPKSRVRRRGGKGRHNAHTQIFSQDIIF